MTQVQTVCGGVRTNVEGKTALVEFLYQIRAGYLVNKPTPFEFFVEGHVCLKLKCSRAIIQKRTRGVKPREAPAAHITHQTRGPFVARWGLL